jgi:hypothetical protein
MDDTLSVFAPYLILLGVLLVPAIIFFVAFTYARVRRGRFRHQHRNRQTHSRRDG